MLFRPTNPTRGLSRTSVVTLVVVILVLLFLGKPISKVFSSVTSGASGAPLSQGTRGNTAITNFLRALVSSRASLLEENQKLTGSLSFFETLKIEKTRLEEENQKLKKILGRTDTRKTVLAGVIGKPNRSPYDSLILDVGKEENIIEGEKLLLHEGRLIIGEIVEVYSHTSRAVLYSSPGITTEAFLGETHTPVTLRGRGGGNFQTELPRGVTVAKNAMITNGGVFPRILGSVTEISLDPREPFQEILITSPFNILELSWVEIMKSE